MGFVRSALAALLLATTEGFPADLPQIEAKGTLRVLVVAGSPAFFSLKASEPPGLEREILEGFARLHHLTLSVVEVPSWDVLIPHLQEGRGELIAGGVTVTLSRQKLVDFSTEVFPTRDVVLTRRPHRVVTTLAELREERVGTIRGTNFVDVISAAGVPQKNVDDSLPATGIADFLRAGRGTAAVDGVEDAIQLQRADPELQIGLFLGARESLAFGVRKGDRLLLAALDDYLSNVRRTATWNRLVIRYFGASAIEILKKARDE